MIKEEKETRVDKYNHFEFFLYFLEQSEEDLTSISDEIYEKLKLLNYEKEMLSNK